MHLSSLINHPKTSPISAMKLPQTLIRGSATCGDFSSPLTTALISPPRKVKLPFIVPNTTLGGAVIIGTGMGLRARSWVSVHGDQLAYAGKSD